jgi:triacylglycerol esterase/lipase EstA (alpha/beta hydrolase family)
MRLSMFRSRRRRPAAGMAAVLLGALCVLPAAAAPHADGGRAGGTPDQRWRHFTLASLDRPDDAPPGADDPNCRPGARHPRPVVLVHGTWSNAYATWNDLAPRLRAEGYCVHAVNYGAPPGEPLKGRAAVPESARELARFVDLVLSRTGAAQVDLVGHSQGGGVLPRSYLKFEGGADAADPRRNKVNRLVGIAPSNHGSTLSGLATLAERTHLLVPAAKLGGQSLADQTIGSAVNTRLDAGGDTMAGVRYTTVVTRADRIATPYQRQYLAPGPGDSAGGVENITLQDVCPERRTGHFATTYDPAVLGLVLHALDPATPARPLC